MEGMVEAAKKQVFNPSLDDILNHVHKSSEKPFFKLGYNLVTTQEPQPSSIEDIKKMFGGNEKSYREVLPYFCDKIPPNQVGRPPRPKKVGRPMKRISRPISDLNTKMQYQPSEEKIEAFKKEMIAMVCDYLDITETQFYRRCRMLEKKLKMNCFPD